MLTRRIYPRPPISEAVIDFRFPASITGEQLLAAVHEALGDQYAGKRRPQELLEFQATMSPGGVSTAARKGLHLTFLASEDGLRLVGCGNGMLSVHVLAPYPGWDVFLEQAVSVVRAASPLLADSGLHQIAVRYIDQIVLPVGDGVSVHDCLTAFPSKPDAMPDSLLAFQYVTNSVDPKDGTVASMILSSAPPGDDGRPVVLFDLTVWRAASPLAGVHAADWVPIVEALHQRQRDIFEGSITDRLRETFQ